MEKKEIEKIIDEKITKAKLVISEKRLGYVLWLAGGLLAFFGVIYPFLQTQQSTKKVDDAIEKMEDRFDELAGIQLRKPNIECEVDNRPLQGANIYISKGSLRVTILLRNTGDAPAKSIKARLYFKVDTPPDWYIDTHSGGTYWEQLEMLDEPDYTLCYELGSKIETIDAKDFHSLELEIYPPSWSTKDYQALLKVYYEQQEPKRYNFTVSIKEN